MAFPTIVTTNSGSLTTQSSHTVTLPSGITAGDLLIVVFAHRQTTAQVWPGGWTPIANSGTNIVHAQYRIADGSEGASITISGSSPAASSSWVSYRITGHNTSTPVEGTGTAAAEATPNPPSLTPTGGSKDYLFICTSSVNSGANAFSAAPTNYGSLIDSGASDTSTSGSRTGAATRNLTASSDDPGVFTFASGAPTSRLITLAVHPAAVLDTQALTGVSSAGAVGDVETSGGTSTHLTEVSISGTQFTINGVVTNPGSPAEGCLMNSRMILAIADDENLTTVVDWEYTDTSEWDPERNTDEFCAMLPTYAAAGLNAVTVGLQGGYPGHGTGGDGQAGIVTAFNSDGTLKSAWTDRLAQVLDAADSAGLVVVVSFYYFGQDDRLTNNAAVQAGVENAVDFLVAGGWTNVLVEVVNEWSAGSSTWYDHTNLNTSAGVITMMQLVTSRSGGALLVSASPDSMTTRSNAFVDAEDYCMIHGNDLTPATLVTAINNIKALSSWIADPKPILVNEDTGGVPNLEAAVGEGVGWGYYDQTGYQTTPVSWAIDTANKIAFFAAVTEQTTEEVVARPPMMITFLQ